MDGWMDGWMDEWTKLSSSLQRISRCTQNRSMAGPDTPKAVESNESGKTQ